MSRELVEVEEQPLVDSKGRDLAEVANAYYRTDGTDVATVPQSDATDTIDNRQAVRQAFEGMAWWNEGAAHSLKERWGSDAYRNLSFAQAFADQHSDIIATLDERYPGMADHPMIVEAAAMLGRRYARVPGDHRTIQGAAPMAAEENKRAQRQELAQIRAEIEEAQSQGKHSLANELFQEEQAIIARHQSQ